MSESIKTPWNPSRKATKRVKNPVPAPDDCRFCGGDVRIAEHKEIYRSGQNYGDWPWVYLCRDCRAYVGMHPFTNIPLGTLADDETRRMRKAAKKPFEQLHRSGRMTRDQAYQALADKLGISVALCHFGWFDAATCRRAQQAAWDLSRALEQSDN